MADKTYKLTFNMSDGSKQEVEFTAPQGPQGEPGKDGADYGLTDADKTEIAEMAAELVDTSLLAIIGTGVVE